MKRATTSLICGAALLALSGCSLFGGGESQPDPGTGQGTTIDQTGVQAFDTSGGGSGTGSVGRSFGPVQQPQRTNPTAAPQPQQGGSQENSQIAAMLQNDQIAASLAPAVMQSTIEQEMGADARLLSPEEKAAAGFRENDVVQLSPDGSYSVLREAETPERFTLSGGETMYSPDGEVLASKNKQYRPRRARRDRVRSVNGGVYNVDQREWVVPPQQGANSPTGVSIDPNPPSPDEAVSDEHSVFEAVNEGIGPVSAGRNFINQTIGAVMDGTPYAETARAKQGIRQFNQEAKTALVNNPRFPVAEQKIIQDMLPNPDRVMSDPDAARGDLVEMRSFLLNKRQNNVRAIQSGDVTTDKAEELKNQVAGIDRVINLMGRPPGATGGWSEGQGGSSGGGINIESMSREQAASWLDSASDDDLRALPPRQLDMLESKVNQ